MNKKRNTIAFILAAALLFLTAGCAWNANAADKPSSPGFVAHFIDVGQADAALIIADGRAMLIDGGNNDDGAMLVKYIKATGVKKLDFVIGTHPHEDHIGGLDDVIKSIPTSSVILSGKAANTKTYRDLTRTTASEKTKKIIASAGAEYALGNATILILAPVKEYEGDSSEAVNNSSVVCKVIYGETSFLFTGDIERAAEKDILVLGKDVSCDVLKVSHHGSADSSSYVFLREANPETAVISCGKNNEYGHPHEETLSRFSDLGASVYRTDKLGSTAFSSDGKTVTANKQGDEPSRERTKEPMIGDASYTVYIGNAKSKVFHTPECRNLPAEKNRRAFTAREDAVREGYKPCGNCNP